MIPKNQCFIISYYWKKLAFLSIKNASREKNVITQEIN